MSGVSQMVLVVKNPPANAGGVRDEGLILGWEDPLEKEMATHSTVLAWRIPGTGEPGGLPSMGSHRVGHDWSSLAAAAEAATLKKTTPTQSRAAKNSVHFA